VSLADIALADGLVIAWFFLCWIGYTRYADDQNRFTRSLMGNMHRYRLEWMRRMIERDNRILDSTIVTMLQQGVNFFASTSIFILAGLMAMLGAGESAMTVVAALPFAVATSGAIWEAKVLLLAAIFVYAFFKFTWGMRLFNYVSTLIGAAPQPTDCTAPEAYADRAARMASRAAEHFNRGIRAYYFGLAALTWFLHPWLFAAASLWVVLVLYRREFRSQVLHILETPS
jgi:uncharacterized membrane protein